MSRTGGPVGYQAGLEAVVDYLAQAAGSYTTAELAEAVNLSASRTGDIVRQLERAGALVVVRKRPKTVEMFSPEIADAVVAEEGRRS